MKLEEFAEADKTKPGQRCRTCNELPDEILRELHANWGTLTAAVMGRWLKDEGFTVTGENVRKHFTSGHPGPDDE